MDPFEDFEQILAETPIRRVVQRADHIDAGDFRRLNRPKTARGSRNPVGKTSNEIIHKHIEDGSQIDASGKTPLAQVTKFKLEDSNSNKFAIDDSSDDSSHRDDDDSSSAVRQDFASGKSANSEPPPRQSHLETLSEVSEELSVEWRDAELVDDQVTPTSGQRDSRSDSDSGGPLARMRLISELEDPEEDLDVEEEKDNEENISQSLVGSSKTGAELKSKSRPSSGKLSEFQLKDIANQLDDDLGERFDLLANKMVTKLEPHFARWTANIISLNDSKETKLSIEKPATESTLKDEAAKSSAHLSSSDLREEPPLKSSDSEVLADQKRGRDKRRDQEDPQVEWRSQQHKVQGQVCGLLLDLISLASRLDHSKIRDGRDDWQDRAASLSLTDDSSVCSNWPESPQSLSDFHRLLRDLVLKISSEFTSRSKSKNNMSRKLEANNENFKHNSSKRSRRGTEQVKQSNESTCNVQANDNSQETSTAKRNGEPAASLSRSHQSLGSDIWLESRASKGNPNSDRDFDRLLDYYSGRMRKLNRIILINSMATSPLNLGQNLELQSMGSRVELRCDSLKFRANSLLCEVQNERLRLERRLSWRLTKNMHPSNLY